ncbi:hypothetical protein KW786_02060 [Candidatus Parcubacteria bacterium]|nr:hypothetical protein [Candidatus Parcubacteria bacterium]
MPKEKLVPIKFKWYKIKVTQYLWKSYYQKQGHINVDEDLYHVWVAYMNHENQKPRADALEITNIEELRKIDLQLRSTNRRPFVFEDKEPSKESRNNHAKNHTNTIQQKIL